MQRTRSGSILLLCLAIVGTLSLLVFGFVRMAQLQQESGAETTKQLLAREAARMGTAHALEQIIRDYATEPFTRLDGPARAPFLPHDLPYMTSGVEMTGHTATWDAAAKRYIGNDLDDVTSDRLLYTPLFTEWTQSGYEGTASFFSPTTEGGGLASSDGRGGYIEPNWHNRFTGPSAAAPAKLRFGQDMAGTALPQRHGALFLDEDFRPVGGDQLVARNAARYRLRYAVSVMDLDGSILMNPDPELDYRRFASADPAGLASPGPRDPDTVRAQHAIAPIISAYGAHGGHLGEEYSGATGGVKAEHVFIGRGSVTNIDQRPGDDTPRFFPLMFRRGSTDGSDFFQYFHTSDGAFGSPASPLRDGAYSLFSMSGVTAAPGGLQAVPLPVKISYMTCPPLRRALLGPQYSFFNLDRCMYGDSITLSAWGNHDGEVKSHGALTPFGRGLVRGADSRFSGPAATPWAVNLLTSPVMVVNGLVHGYLPPGALMSFSATLSGTTATPIRLESRTGRDLFVQKINPAFRYAAPAAEGVDPNYHVQHVLPGDAGYRLAADRYPGEMGFNGFATTALTSYVNDTLGFYLRAGNAGGAPGAPKPTLSVTQPPNYGLVKSGDGCEDAYGAFDPYTGMAFLRTTVNSETPNPTPSSYPIAGIHQQMYTLTPPDSVWRAVVQAMAAATAVARAQVMQYPTAVADPATLFDGGPWTDATVQGIADIDRLFLANLGIDIANPGSPIPPGAGAPQSLRAWYGTRTASPSNGAKIAYRSFVPGWNVASLRALPAFDDGAGTSTLRPHAPYTAAERTACIEMVLNDFRLSFFGANPAYADFQLLDLNGDGQVNCSALPSVGAGRAYDLGIDHCAPGATAVPRSAIAADSVFCLTGCFTVTKSHFWRVISRGEVWDNLFKTVAGQAALDTVVCVDPMDTAREVAAPANRDPVRGQYATHVMYQRWFFDFNRVSMSRKMW